VPAILEEGPGGLTYLLQDLGDTTLFSLLDEGRTGPDFLPDNIRTLYLRRSNTSLRSRSCQVTPSRLISATRDPHSTSVHDVDLNYFKYYFLKLAGIPFDEQQLEEDSGFHGIPSECSAGAFHVP